MADITLSYKGSTIAEVSASGTTKLNTKGKFCEDDISLQYEKPVSPWSYLGANPVKVLDIAETETALSATGFNTWTPSTTATEIVGSSDAGTLELNLANYDYVVLWFFDISIAYNGTEENKAKILRQVQCMRHEIYKSPGSITSLQQSNYDYNRYTSMFVSSLLDVYNSSSVHTIAYVQSSGVYPLMTAGTFSNNTSDTPTLTLKTPLIRAQCNATYWSTANAGKVDKANSKFKLRGEVWRVDKRGVLGEMYKNIVDMYNGN